MSVADRQPAIICHLLLLLWLQTQQNRTLTNKSSFASITYEHCHHPGCATSLPPPCTCRPLRSLLTLLLLISIAPSLLSAVCGWPVRRTPTPLTLPSNDHTPPPALYIHKLTAVPVHSIFGGALGRHPAPTHNQKITPASSSAPVSGELFEHDQPRSQCFQVQPVTCCDLLGFLY